MSSPDIRVLRYAAFTDHDEGGNPAGVVISDAHPPEAEMQRIAAEVGYSETAFLHPVGDRHHRLRYFSPLAEVPFCGHATVAAAAVLGERDGAGSFRFDINDGSVGVDAGRDVSGRLEATLVSPPATTRDVQEATLDAALRALRYERADLDPALAPAVASAGAAHLIVALDDRPRLAALDYDFDALRDVMAGEGWTTVAVVWRESATRFHARNPFPVGGVVEDPATGAAAAALGGYLRERGGLRAPAAIEVLQGQDMGIPCRLHVDVVPDRAGIAVRGTVRALGPPP